MDTSNTASDEQRNTDALADEHRAGDGGTAYELARECWAHISARDLYTCFRGIGGISQPSQLGLRQPDVDFPVEESNCGWRDSLRAENRLE